VSKFAICSSFTHKASRAESIVVSLKVFQGVASQIVREHPSLLSDVPLSARLGFPEAVYPGTSRNDLYVKLWSAYFAPSPVSSGGSIRVRKTAMPSNNGNVQVTVEVRKTDGTIIPDAIYAGGSGEPPVVQYHSLVFQHNDKPTYGELIKVSLAKQATDCHLFLTFRSRGKERHLNPDFQELERPFAFAYLPLFSSTECIKDGSHDLFLYRMEKNLQPAPNLYFDAPFTVDSDSVRSLNIVKSMTPLRDRMMLRTYLCSSQFTQDDTLRALFAWQRSSTDAGILPSLLQMFGFVSEEEIAKFVPSVFDALFRILVANLGDSQDAVDNLVFNCLMKVLAMTSDRRFPNFVTILDVYIVSQFNHPAISSHLLHSMQSLMTNPKAKEYRSFLKVWHLFFRFIIRSRELDRAPGVGLDATSAHIEADFKRQTRAILTEINTLMLSKDKGLIGTQVLAVQHYADILPNLAQVFPPLEIAEMVIAFADTLILANGSIAIYKLLLLLEVVKLVFDSAEARALLVPAMVRWVKPHLGRVENAASGDLQGIQDGKRIKWLECNRLAITVSQPQR